jgi:hypothetical protein
MATPQATSDNRSDYYTIFTKAGGTQTLVQVPQYAKITFELETAGPVSVGTRAQLDPVGSGKGALLTTDKEFEMLVGPNTTIYYAATGLHRVKVKIEAIPWLRTLNEGLLAIVAAINGLRQAAPRPAPAPAVRKC